jgi:L-alanine-DL-glutamate epimerase-like enolase superfamily enzyme
MIPMPKVDINIHSLSSQGGALLPFAFCLRLWLPQPFAVVDGFVDVPQEPGLGVTLDEAVLERYRVG